MMLFLTLAHDQKESVRVIREIRAIRVS